MAKQEKKPVFEAPDPSETPIETALVIRNKYQAVHQKYDRPVTKFEVKATLTHNLTAMVHEGEMLCEILSDVYTMNLPVKGRVETAQEARVIDVYDIPNREIKTCILNETMVRALSDAMKSGPIIGRCFGFRCHDMVADKRYRMVDVTEVDLSQEPQPNP